jgi:hypothetical protein
MNQFKNFVNVFCLLIIGFSPIISIAQNHKFKHVSHIEGQASGGNDWGHAVMYDNQKNVYTVGHFAGTSDFDPGPNDYLMTTDNYSDIFIQKVDSNGNFLWAAQFGQILDWEYGRDVCITPDGGVLITGNCTSSVDFDPGPGVVNGSQVSGKVFVLKLDSNGVFEWVKNFGGSNFESGYKITTDSLGNIYTAGYSMSPVIDFDPGMGSYPVATNGSRDIWISKLDQFGNLIWAKVYGGSGDDYAFGLLISNGFVYLSGEFRQTVNFDPGGINFTISSNGGSDAFIQKLTLNGDVIWTKRIGASAEDQAKCMSTNSQGDLLIGGQCSGTIDFDPGLGDSIVQCGNFQIYILKLNSNGEFGWVKTALSNSGWGFVNGICVDNSDNVFVTGRYDGVLSLDVPIGYNTAKDDGSWNLFVAKLDPSGQFSWAKSIYSINNQFEEGMDIEVDVNTNLYLTGTFWSYTDFDPGANTVYNSSIANMGDVFTLILEPCQCQDTLTYVVSCDSYTSVNNNVYSNDTISFELLSDMHGCDSIVVLDIAILYSSNSIEHIHVCEPYTWMDGVTYNSSIYTPTWTLTNSEGCDSVVTLYLSIYNVDSSVTQLNEVTLKSNQNGVSYQWFECLTDSTYVPLIGEVFQTFVADSNGNYAVIVTNVICSDTSECISINSVGVDDLSNNTDHSILISPNPSNGIFINTVNGSKFNIELYDISWRSITNITQSDSMVTVHDYSPGIYYLKIEFENQTFLERLVLQ